MKNGAGIRTCQTLSVEVLGNLIASRQTNAESTPMVNMPIKYNYTLIHDEKGRSCTVYIHTLMGRRPLLSSV